MAVSRDTTFLSNPALLEKIDKLRDLNIGQHISLPQVISENQQRIIYTDLHLLTARCGGRPKLWEILLT
jgi:hypothetical protein